MNKTLIVAACLIFVACNNQKEDQNIKDLGRAKAQPTSQQMVQPQATKKAPMGGMPAAMPADAGKIHKGKISELIQVKNYSYILLQNSDEEKLWIAIPKGEFKANQEVEIVQNMIMNNFKSTTLDRTFETIVFGTIKGETPKEGDDSALPKGHPPIK